MSSTSAADGPVGDRPARHFVVVKRGGFSRDGIRLSAWESAFSLLDCGIWPLWSHTRNRKAIAAGDRLAVYLSDDGDGQVVATATVRQVGPWSRSLASAYPLDLDGIPYVVLHLQHVEVLQLRNPALVITESGNVTNEPSGHEHWNSCLRYILNLWITPRGARLWITRRGRSAKCSPGSWLKRSADELTGRKGLRPVPS